MKDHDNNKPKDLDLDSLNQELQKSLESKSKESGPAGGKDSHRLKQGHHRRASGMVDDFDIPIAKPRVINKDNNISEKKGKRTAGGAAGQTGPSKEMSQDSGVSGSGQDQGSDQTVRIKTAGKKDKRIRWGTLIPRVLLGLLVLLLVGLAGTAGTLLYLQHKGETSMTANKSKEDIRLPEGAEKDGDYIIYKGHKYKYNENLITVLCMGIDKRISETGKDSIGNNGSADTIMLAVLDQRTNNLSFVNISREAMVDIRQYNTEGEYTGLKNLQVCLAYAYGDGHESSCENELDAVSRLMYGMPIHAYAALDYDGIAVLNDAIGGVTVNVLEDLTASDPELAAGSTVTLKGDQAQTYVRSRQTALLESNNLRMERQKQYMTNYVRQLIEETKSDITTPITVYRAAEDHVVSDIGVDGIVYLTSKVMKSGIMEGQVFSIPGQVKNGGTYAEFIPDQKKLYKMVLEVFYEMVE